MAAIRWFFIGLAIAGCASAGKGNSIIGGLTDAGDALPRQVTLAQTASTSITGSNMLVCVHDATGLTSQNSYYRVFVLDDYGLTTTLHVAQVDFGIELADAGRGATLQPAQVQLGTYRTEPGEVMLDPAQIRALSAVDIRIPNGEGTRMTVPIAADVAPGTNLIVELIIPDGRAAGSVFVIGSNAEGERRPGYMSSEAADCGLPVLPVPTTMQSIAMQIKAREVDVLLSVTGTH